jgi:hypothetical protein
MITHNSRHHTCELITAKDGVFGRIQHTSPAYRLQAASIVEKLPRRLLNVRHGTGSPHLNLLCSSSHAPHLMLLFSCSSFHALHSILFVLCLSFHAPHSVILILSTVSASALGDIHFIPTLDAIPKVLASIHRQTTFMERWNANEQRSTRVLNVNSRIVDILERADQRLKSTSYVH